MGELVAVGTHPDVVAAGLGDRGVGDGAVAAALGEDGSRDVEHVADEVRDGVHTLGGQRPDALDHPVAVGHRLGTELTEAVVVALGRRPDDAGAERPGDLDRQGADATGRGVHEDGVALADLEALQQAQGGEAGERQAGCLVPRHRGGLGGQGAHRSRRTNEDVERRRIARPPATWPTSRTGSTEFDPDAKHPVISTMADQEDVVAGERDMGGTMRLGRYPAKLAEGTLARELYGQPKVDERHRHRYEVNNSYREQLEKVGMVFSGPSPDGRLVEYAELPAEVHPFFIGTQAHPEFRSRPTRANPMFKGLIGAALTYADSRETSPRPGGASERRRGRRRPRVRCPRRTGPGGPDVPRDGSRLLRRTLPPGGSSPR